MKKDPQLDLEPTVYAADLSGPISENASQTQTRFGGSTMSTLTFVLAARTGDMRAGQLGCALLLGRGLEQDYAHALSTGFARRGGQSRGGGPA